MASKVQKMTLLRERLIKYSRQMGIVDCEIPVLVFYGEEYKDLKNKRGEELGMVPSHTGGRYTKYLGLCHYYQRLIFVNIRGKRDLRQLTDTLIHELVHYRFHYLSHTNMGKRIQLIKQGKEYPRKHIDIPLNARMI